MSLIAFIESFGSHTVPLQHPPLAWLAQTRDECNFMTFIREWTGPENSMDPGLRKAWLDASRANETNDRNNERIPSSGADSSSSISSEQKKAAIKPALSGRCRLGVSLGSGLPHGCLHDEPPDRVEPNGSSNVSGSAVQSVTRNRSSTHTILTNCLSTAVFQRSVRKRTVTLCGSSQPSR